MNGYFKVLILPSKTAIVFSRSFFIYYYIEWERKQFYNHMSMEVSNSLNSIVIEFIYVIVVHTFCWGLALKYYELRTRQHKMLNINALRPSKDYFHNDLMNFGRRTRT
jgi:hypothetical protein